MKKILASLVILALCAPAMAATVSIADNGGGSATITVAAEGALNIVGLGLDIDVDGGAQVTAVSVDTATFNIYPDAAQALGGSYTYGAGTPVADQDAAGELVLPQSSFAISVGALNGETTPGATGSASVQITITVDASCNLCVKENALRGGIVLTDGTGEDITNGTAGEVCAAISVGPGCQDYNLTKLAGGIDNLVNVQDLNALVDYVNNNKLGALWVVNANNPNWNPIYNITAKQGGIDTLVNVQDLNALVDYVNNTKTGALWVVNCNNVP